MANITLRLEDELLSQVRRLAFERNTSVNAIVVEKLTELVKVNKRKEEVLSGLEAFYRRVRAEVGAIAWDRDALHER